jgi:hypothetical protein
MIGSPTAARNTSPCADWPKPASYGCHAHGLAVPSNHREQILSFAPTTGRRAAATYSLATWEILEFWRPTPSITNGGGIIVTTGACGTIAPLAANRRRYGLPPLPTHRCRRSVMHIRQVSLGAAVMAVVVATSTAWSQGTVPLQVAPTSAPAAPTAWIGANGSPLTNATVSGGSPSAPSLKRRVLLIGKGDSATPPNAWADWRRPIERRPATDSCLRMPVLPCPPLRHTPSERGAWKAMDATDNTRTALVAKAHV